MAGIDDWDKAALEALYEDGPGTAADLVERVGIEQFDEGMARAWIKDALSRGVIAKTGDAGRYAITRKGEPS
jgi:hypothetical protein